MTERKVERFIERWTELGGDETEFWSLWGECADQVISDLSNEINDFLWALETGENYSPEQTIAVRDLIHTFETTFLYERRN